MKPPLVGAAEMPALLCPDCHYWHITALHCSAAQRLAGAAKAIELRHHYALCALCQQRHPSNMSCDAYAFIAKNIVVFVESARHMAEVLQTTFASWIQEIAIKDDAYRRLDIALAALAKQTPA